MRAAPRRSQPIRPALAPERPFRRRLAWEELSPAVKSDHFTVSNLTARLDCAQARSLGSARADQAGAADSSMTEREMRRRVRTARRPRHAACISDWILSAKSVAR